MQGQPSSSNAPMTPAADPGYAQMIDFQHPTRGKLYMWFQKVGTASTQCSVALETPCGYHWCMCACVRVCMHVCTCPLSSAPPSLCIHFPLCILLCMVRLATQEQCNVLYFYHDKTGSWVPVPLVWESQVPSIAKLTKDVQVAMVTTVKWSVAMSICVA